MMEPARQLNAAIARSHDIHDSIRKVYDKGNEFFYMRQTEWKDSPDLYDMGIEIYNALVELKDESENNMGHMDVKLFHMHRRWEPVFKKNLDMVRADTHETSELAQQMLDHIGSELEFMEAEVQVLA